MAERAGGMGQSGKLDPEGNAHQGAFDVDGGLSTTFEHCIGPCGLSRVLIESCMSCVMSHVLVWSC